MPWQVHMIAQGLDDLGKALITAGNTLRSSGWAVGEGFVELCKMKACLDELARETLSDGGQQRLARTLEWMASPEHKSRTLAAFSTLQKLSAEGAPQEVEAFKKRYQKKARRQAAAIERIRARKKTKPSK